VRHIFEPTPVSPDVAPDNDFFRDDQFRDELRDSALATLLQSLPEFLQLARFSYGLQAQKQKIFKIFLLFLITLRADHHARFCERDHGARGPRRSTSTNVLNSVPPRFKPRFPERNRLRIADVQSELWFAFPVDGFVSPLRRVVRISQ
jgi:hypothetical protein